MGEKITRRSFIKAGAATGLGAAVTGRAASAGPSMVAPASVKPVVIASANGNKYKNGGLRTAVEEAFERIVKGEDTLDAAIAGVNICELDPEDTSVGYGGLPNADGVVQLDSCCMHGPSKRAGGVACLEGVRTPSLVAQAVMEHTDHHLLVGAGARRFARNMGFTIEDDLNTDTSRARWLEWKRRIDPKHYLDPAKRSEASERISRQMMAEGLIDPDHYYGTINCNAVNAAGEVSGVTTTSGLAWKIPGRVGDSPILGAGLYVDGEIGAAGSTGRGEANLFGLCSYLIVEKLREGLHPKDAGMEALRRIKAATVEKRLLNSQGEPNFYVNFYIVNRKGEFAGVSLYSTYRGRERSYAVCTENGPETRPCDALLGEAPAA
jgi:N4-(beta-N-acetylglucosaminyl)-L-asparaginase